MIQPNLQRTDYAANAAEEYRYAAEIMNEYLNAVPGGEPPGGLKELMVLLGFDPDHAATFAKKLLFW